MTTITCSLGLLAGALRIVKRVVANNSSIPAVTCMRLVADEERLSITGTNLEIGARIDFPRIGGETGHVAALVPARTFADIVDTFTGEEVSLAFLDGEIRLESGGSKAKFKTMPAEDFPPEPVAEYQAMTIGANDLKKAFRRVAFAASADETRPLLRSVQLAKAGSHATMTAADGFRLASLTLDAGMTLPPEGSELTIHQAAANFLAAVLPSTDGMVAVKTSKDCQVVVFEWESTRFWALQVEGKYPNWQQIIPPEFKHQVSVPRDAALVAVNRAEIFAHNENHVVRFASHNGGDTLVSGEATETGRSETVLPGVAFPLPVALNGIFVQQGLEAFDGKEVALHLNASLAPVMFRTDDASYTYLLMPMHTADNVQKAAQAAQVSATAVSAN